MNLIAIYGAGLLVGAAIIVIVPEGMLVLFESMINPDLLIIEAISSLSASPDGTEVRGLKLVEAHGHGSAGLIDHSVTKYVGLSMITGFTIMLILDQGFLILQERQMRKLALQS